MIFPFKQKDDGTFLGFLKKSSIQQYLPKKGN